MNSFDDNKRQYPYREPQPMTKIECEELFEEKFAEKAKNIKQKNIRKVNKLIILLPVLLIAMVIFGFIKTSGFTINTNQCKIVFDSKYVVLRLDTRWYVENEIISNTSEFYKDVEVQNALCDNKIESKKQ